MCKQIANAKDLYFKGYNCAQAVAGAFSAETGIEMDTLLKMASGFGGGVAGMREICGAVSGMMMVTGLVKGSESVLSREGKEALNQELAKMAADFKNEFGCLRCDDLLQAKDSDIPQRDYCAKLVSKAAGLAAGAIAE